MPSLKKCYQARKLGRLDQHTTLVVLYFTASEIYVAQIVKRKIYVFGHFLSLTQG